jgi:hypothetical protein
MYISLVDYLQVYLGKGDDMKRLMLCLLLAAMLFTSSQAISYKKTAGPWTAEFNATPEMNTRNHYEEPTQEGYSWWMMTLMDKAGHEVAWLSFRSYSNPQKSSDDFLDQWLDKTIGIYKVTSPTKTSVTIDGTNGRMAEGYSSEFSRKWRGIVWPYRSYFDTFTNTNMTKHFIALDSLQDQAEFQYLVDSLHVTNVTYM